MIYTPESRGKEDTSVKGRYLLSKESIRRLGIIPVLMIASQRKEA